MKTLEGAIYSVEDVSDLLGIPRPTLYRYLREYSIPHLRQGGRIQIPEDSFDRIREARDLHKEGLGTESVRRQLREGGPDPGDLDRRLNRLHDTLEDLKGDIKSRPGTGEVALSPALQTILARQSLMLSAMFNLTGMVEDLLLSNGRSRRRSVPRLEDGATPITVAAEDRGELPGTIVADHEPIRRTEDPTVAVPAESPTRFGSLARRRRRSTLALLSAAALALLLVVFIPTLGEDTTASTGQPAAGNTEGQRSPEENPSGAGAADDQDAPANDAGNGDTDNGDTDNDNGAAGEVAAATDEGATDEAGTTPTGEDTAAAPTTSGAEEGVPDVSGQPVEEAARSLSEAGYTVAAIRSRTGPEDPGTVTGTEPSAGTNAPSDAPVVLTMSTGPAGTSSADASSAGTSPASATASAGASPTSAVPAGSSSASASAPASPSP